MSNLFLGNSYCCADDFFFVGLCSDSVNQFWRDIQTKIVACRKRKVRIGNWIYVGNLTRVTTSRILAVVSQSIRCDYDRHRFALTSGCETKRARFVYDRRTTTRNEIATTNWEQSSSLSCDDDENTAKKTAACSVLCSCTARARCYRNPK